MSQILRSSTLRPWRASAGPAWACRLAKSIAVDVMEISDLSDELITNAISRHRETPHVSLAAYVKQKTVELGAAISAIPKVYLDKRFWILLRDAQIGRKERQSVKVLLRELLRAADEGEVLCPISDSIFLELMKQRHAETRRKTAALIDRLSRGVTLVPFEQRVAQEIVGIFVMYGAYEKDSYRVDELVWSKLSYVLGVVHPVSGQFEPADELALQKAFFDCMWEIDLVEILDQLQEKDIARPQTFNDTPRKLNELNEKYRGHVRSFRQVYLDEFRGGLSLFMHIPRLWLQEIYERSTGSEPSVGDREKAKHEEELYSFFGELITKHEVALMMPTLHILSLCHAAVRWDQRRKLTGNDLYDFNHSAAGISYCDALFTEKPLKSMLEQRHLSIDRDFQCHVISDIDEAVRWIRDNSVG